MSPVRNITGEIRAAQKSSTPFSVLVLVVTMGTFLGNSFASNGIMQMTVFVVLGVRRFRQREEGTVMVSVNWKHLFELVIFFPLSRVYAFQLCPQESPGNDDNSVATGTPGLDATQKGLLRGTASSRIQQDL